VLGVAVRRQCLHRHAGHLIWATRE
jgi:hypothetical protein